MKKLGTVLFAAVALALLAPAEAEAQEPQTMIGPYLAFHDDADFGIGAFVTVPVPSIHENFALGGDFGFYFPDEGGFGGVDVSYWELNANAFMGFPLEGNDDILPFAMGGLNIARFSVDADDFPGAEEFGDTELGLNLGGGIAFTGLGNLQPVAGLKVELNGGEGFVVFGGLGFPVGGGM